MKNACERQPEPSRPPPFVTLNNFEYILLFYMLVDWRDHFPFANKRLKCTFQNP